MAIFFYLVKLLTFYFYFGLCYKRFCWRCYAKYVGAVENGIYSLKKGKQRLCVLSGQF